MVATDFCLFRNQIYALQNDMQGLEEEQTSEASGKTPFLKYDIISNGQQKFVKRQKCEPGHENLRARSQSTSMLQ